MDNYSKIYWLTRLDSIQSACIVLLILSIVAIFLYAVLYPLWRVENDEDEDIPKYGKTYGIYKRIAIWVGSICLLIITFLPSKNEMILIYAGGKTMNYIESDTSLQKIPYQTTTIISDYLDKQIKDLKEEK
jgi:hypothetical protein